LKKEIEEGYRRWKDLPLSWIGRINIVKMAILPKAIYMFNMIPIKILMTLITEIEKSTLKFIWKHKRPVNSQGNPEQEEQPWKNHNTWLQTILQRHSIKNNMVLAQKQIRRPVEQNRGPDMNPCSYTQLIFDKGANNIQWRKDSLFNKYCWEKSGYPPTEN
jgi:hypothetical protein